MIVADTNVWARAYLGDHHEQGLKARKVLSEAQAGTGVFVPLIVLAELAWVLRTRMDRSGILALFEKQLNTRGVSVERAEIVRATIQATREGNGGFTDHLIAHVGFAHGATEILTFDDKLGKSAKVRQLH